jgi:PhnB protein
VTKLQIRQPVIRGETQMEVQPYLFFEGRCEEAIEFYRSAVGAEVIMIVRFKDNPKPPPPGTLKPGTENNVMHGRLQIGRTTVLVSDGRCEGPASFKGFGLSLTVSDEAAAARLFNGLSDGGEVRMPLGRTFFSPSFGMVKDRFGVLWMVYVTPKDQTTS